MVEQKRIEDLPLNGRHVFNLVKVVAGVVPRSNATDGFAEVSNQTFSQMRINGGPAYGNQFFLDGVSNTAAVHNEIAVVPMADSVQEFRVDTNALKAEYGQTAGGVINAVTPADSFLLKRPLYEAPPTPQDHPNATFIDVNDSDYKLFLLWITNGAKP